MSAIFLIVPLKILPDLVFGNLLITIATLKAAVYEGVPFIVLITLNILQLVIIPTVLISLLNYKINAITTLLYILLLNIPFLGNMAKCVGLKTVLLYTTSVTNAWGLLFFIV